jgi:EAL and modified HD-GYP domain-containing signal transduction protein
MRDLFKRLLGGKAEKTGDSRQAFAELNREAPLLPAEPGSAGSGEAEGFVCRETLLGRDQRVAGYHFLLQQATRTRLASRSRRIHHIYAEVLVRNLIRMDIGRLLGHRLAFIDLPDSFLGHESLLMLPPANTVLTVATLPDEGAPTPSAVLEQVRALRARGYRFAVNAMANEAPGAYLLPEAEFVVVRVDSAEPKRIRDFADALKRTTPPRTWLARGLPGHDEFQLCFNLGAGLFQGPFITRREDWTGNSLGPNAARIADLLSRLRRDEELADIAASLKQDPALSLRLLRYINSAAMGLREEVTSIERALMQLGRDRLYRWLSLLLYGADSRNPNASALLETALVRARMLELLGEGGARVTVSGRPVLAGRCGAAGADGHGAGTARGGACHRRCRAAPARADGAPAAAGHRQRIGRRDAAGLRRRSRRHRAGTGQRRARRSPGLGDAGDGRVNRDPGRRFGECVQA